MVRCSMSMDNFIMHLLQAISIEYDSIMTSINSYVRHLDLENVWALLLSQEMHTQSATTKISLYAHIVEKQKKVDQQNNHNP